MADISRDRSMLTGEVTVHNAQQGDDIRYPVLIQSSAGKLRSEMGPFEARGYLGSPCDDLGFRRRETPTSTCTEARRRSLGHDVWQTRVGCRMEYYEAPADPWLPDAVAVPALGAELNVLYVG